MPFPFLPASRRIYRITFCAAASTLLLACSMDAQQEVGGTSAAVTNVPVAQAPATNLPPTPPVPAPVPAADTNAPAATPLPPATPTPGVEPRFVYSSAHVDGPYIAMTFDDGPHPKNTPKLLDLLAAKHIKATFFVIGENAVRYPELLKREIAEGHEIGNHTWTHLNCLKSSDDKIRDELKRTDAEILTDTGVKPVFMRPPYGNLNQRQRRWVHDEFGYTLIFWDVDPLDWKEPGVNVVANRIISAVRPGSIILSHDIHAPTIEAMPIVFDALLAKGYKFVTVSELIAMNKTVVKPEAAKASPVPAGVKETTVPAVKSTEVPIPAPAPTPVPAPEPAKPSVPSKQN